MTKRLLILFSFVFCLNSFGITHAECEQAKEALLNNLDAIDNRVATISNIVTTVLDTIGFDSGSYTKYISDGVEHPTTTYLIPIYDSNGNDIGTIGSLVLTPLETISQSNLDISRRSSDMRALIQSIQCDDSTNGCQCAEQLAVISANVDSINQSVSLMYLDSIDWYVSIYGLLDNWENLWLEDSEFYHSELGKIDNFLSLYTNNLFRAFFSSYGFSQLPITTSSDLGVLGRFNILDESLSKISRTINIRRSGSSNFQSFIYQYGQYVPTALAVLNRWSNAHWLQLNQLTNSVFSIETNVSQVSSQFSIFNDFVFSSDAPLSMYTDKHTDGSYHDYLTNYYIKVSKGQQSGSDSFTNWFSRVELLLAALVFQDEDDSTINTNGVPSESDKNSVTEVGSSLGQTISGFVQDGNSHVSSVDTSGKSIIRMVSSWNIAIGQTAKPAPFVVAEFTAPDSQSRSNISLWLDTEDEKLSSLIEIGHGISTLSWVAVFLLLGYNLAVYSIRVLRKLISFSFSLYSAIFGGG